MLYLNLDRQKGEKVLVGRKRISGPRYDCGKLKSPAKAQKLGPTAELIAKRVARLVVAGVDPAKAPPTLANTGLAGPEQCEFFRLAESWLGVLYAANVINPLQFRAGLRFHHLYSQSFPQGFPGSSLDADLERISGVPVQPWQATDSDLGEAWKLSENILATLDRRVHFLIKQICVFGEFVGFIDKTSPKADRVMRADAQDRTRFVMGLDALAMAYGYKATPKKMGIAA